MSKKVAQPQEASANAKFTIWKLKPATVADTTQKRADFIKQNPNYQTQPLVQQVVTAWVAASAVVNKADQDIKTARVALVGLIAGRRTAFLAYGRATGNVLKTIDTVTNGSAQAIKEWGFDIVTRTPRNVTSEAPQGLRVSYTKALDFVVRWNGIVGHLGYNVQIGDGTPNGWGPVQQSPKASFTPQGLTPGQHVLIRVAVQRKSGLSAWSDSLAVTVR